MDDDRSSAGDTDDDAPIAEDATDARDDAVIAADATGMLAGERFITNAEIEEALETGDSG